MLIGYQEGRVGAYDDRRMLSRKISEAAAVGSRERGYISDADVKTGRLGGTRERRPAPILTGRRKRPWAGHNLASLPDGQALHHYPV